MKPSASRKPSVPVIKKAVAQHFDIPLETLKAKTSIARVVLARQVAMYLARELTDASLVGIGSFFGNRDHSTVLHACAKVRAAAEADPALKRKLQTILEELSA
jgi:chromosomal replication initiator protein